jgi:uncharacterized protein
MQRASLSQDGIFSIHFCRDLPQNRQMFTTLLLIALFAYLLIMAGMFAFQRRLMYIPETTILEPEHYGIGHTTVLTLESDDKVKLAVWHVAAADASLPLLVYYHGNAGHIGDRMAKISHFAAAGFGVLAVSYRGYGKSEGAPSETGLYADARATLRYALTTLQRTPQDILLYGESLGTGVATQMASEMAATGTPVGGLILEAPYTSVARRAQEMYPFIPARWLARDKYHSIDKIAAIDCPLLLFHGERDTVIPVHHGRALLAAAREPKQGIFFPDVDHTAFDFPTLGSHVLQFAQSLQRMPEKVQA